LSLANQTKANMNTSNNPIPSADDTRLIAQVAAAVQTAGQAVLDRFHTEARPVNRRDIGAMIAANDAVSLTILQAALSIARPTAQWMNDEGGSGHLPKGEWWIVDPVEGAINHIHGLPEWGVTATLVRDNVPVLTAVHLPLYAQTYTALRGGGAWLNGKRLQASLKTELNAARAGTGQAVPDEGSTVYNCIGRSVSAMLEAALVVQVSVPATLQLLQVAAGHQDLFWQYSQVRSGLLAGALLVAEAGCSVTDLNGAPWHLDSGDFLACAPDLLQQAVSVLSPIARNVTSAREQS
jgi:myo-inositol-1(or 4)-monophosphatase